ncbi:iron-sulfur cluster biosynthesis family protein [Paenibacillus sp. JSM ZJ436]|uniref:iron-sulfur cluster biosynthesis family protein n=1 Tax=Paenibacillus sp. JSM ZJ436 TaxID=3376190 RepID=UPI00378C193E
MMIQLTEAAEQKLKGKLHNSPGVIRLIHDSEGCGCVMSAVPGLEIIEQPGENDVALDTKASYPIYMSRNHEVFFEEALMLDLNSSGLHFRLSSTGQTYSTNVKLVDRRLKA